MLDCNWGEQTMKKKMITTKVTKLYHIKGGVLRMLWY